MAPSGWSQFLGELVTETHERHGVMLSALVVHADDLQPGEGFVGLAVDKGWVPADIPEAAAIERLRGASVLQVLRGLIAQMGGVAQSVAHLAGGRQRTGGP